MYIDECLVHLERKMLARKDMDLNEHERLSNITLKHKVKSNKNIFILLFYTSVTVGSSTMVLTHALK
jgi:hypothetical protein